MNGKKLAAWIGGLTATIAAVLAFGSQWDGFNDRTELLAQEAGTVAAERVVEERMSPVQAELVDIREGQDRAFLEKKWDQCMTYSHPDADPEVRRIRCDDEREWRRTHLKWERCIERTMQADSLVAHPEDAIPECGIEPELGG